MILAKVLAGKQGVLRYCCCVLIGIITNDFFGLIGSEAKMTRRLVSSGLAAPLLCLDG